MLKPLALLLVLATSFAAQAQSLSSAATGGGMSLSAPEPFGSWSGTNTTADTWIFYLGARGGYNSGAGYFRTYVSATVCGQPAGLRSNESRSGWYTMWAGMTVIVPPGCDYSFGRGTNGYSYTSTLYRQVLAN